MKRVVWVGQELTDVNSAGSNQSSPLTSEEVARQIRAVIDPLSKQTAT